jgi:hypothetical protein
MEGDRFFLDSVGRHSSRIRCIARQHEVFYCASDFIRTVGIPFPRSIKARLLITERTRAIIEGRSKVFLSPAGLIGLIPARKEYSYARECAIELIKSSYRKIEVEEETQIQVVTGR